MSPESRAHWVRAAVPLVIGLALIAVALTPVYAHAPAGRWAMIGFGVLGLLVGVATAMRPGTIVGLVVRCLLFSVVAGFGLFGLVGGIAQGRLDVVFWGLVLLVVGVVPIIGTVMLHRRERAQGGAGE